MTASTRRWLLELLDAIPTRGVQVNLYRCPKLIGASITVDWAPERRVEVAISAPWPVVALCERGGPTPSFPVRRRGYLGAVVSVALEWLATGDWERMVTTLAGAPAATAQDGPGRTDDCGDAPIAGDAPDEAVGPLEGL